jgi:radical SAM protein with 4Fe4S-binding SPASM domain
MMSWKLWWNDLLNRGLGTGTHSYIGSGDLGGHRFHLRVDSEQKGVLMIDAAKLVFLNGTALDYVRAILECWSPGKMTRYMRRRYRKLDRSRAMEHYGRVRGQLADFIKGRTDIISSMGPSTPTVGADNLPAPYRMDLALTYRCQNDCGHCYNETKDKPELAPGDWERVLEKLWKVGVPHIVFTGGEPTLVPFLRDLIARAQQIGQVTGLITNGRNLRQDGYLRGLVDAGLDHVQITLLSHRESVHDKLTGSAGSWKETVEGIRVAVKENLYVATNTTLMSSNIDEMEDTLRFVIGLGVKNVAFNGMIRSGKGTGPEALDLSRVEKTLDRLKRVADDAGVNMVWYAPTPYCELNPVNHGFGIKQCTACSINMAVEPDGTVIPCQSCYEPLGNILTDEWKKIWHHPLCKEFRERGYLTEKCRSCEQMELCGGGCPLSARHGDYLCTDRDSNA